MMEDIFRNQKGIALSPMAGYTDSPFRRLVREYGSTFTYTEFVSTEAIIRNSRKTFSMLRFLPEERPIIFQIFGSRPEVIAEAVKILAELSPDAIDLNMGCSVKRVAHRGSGAGLLREPEKVKNIFHAMKRASTVPVTAKIRLGWDSSSLNYREIARILEGEGASAIFVHGRTKSMGYSGKADWEKIQEVKQSVSIPVYGNGDVISREDAEERIRKYNLNGVLIGRHAMGNPWIFSGMDKSSVSKSEKHRTMIRHIDWMVEFYGEKMGVRLFRKHFVHYTRGCTNAAELRQKGLMAVEKRELLKVLDEFL